MRAYKALCDALTIDRRNADARILNLKEGNRSVQAVAKVDRTSRGRLLDRVVDDIVKSLAELPAHAQHSRRLQVRTEIQFRIDGAG